MKYLKLFEDIDIDPFDEENWNEDDFKDIYGFSSTKDIFKFLRNTKFKNGTYVENRGMRYSTGFITDWNINNILITYDDYIHIIGHNDTDLEYRIYNYNGDNINNYRNDIPIYNENFENVKKLIRRINWTSRHPNGLFGGGGDFGF